MSSQLIYQRPQAKGEMPDLVTGTKPLSFFEFWPGWLFYFPMKLYSILWLSLRHGGMTLPTVTDPLFEAGGLVCESKSHILDQVPDSLKPQFCAHITVEKKSGSVVDDLAAQAMADMQGAGFGLPCVIKPDIGARGVGVQIAYSQADIASYLRSFPEGEKVMLQEMADYPYEAGLFYIRHPDAAKGQIFSLTLKYFPFVVGDGVSTLKQLIENDSRAAKIAHIYLPRHQHRLSMVLPQDQKFRIAFAGSHSRGTIFKNGASFITPEMEASWDRFCQQLPEFYFGRFDVRFHSLQDLQTAQNIKIIEINGASAEATHIWDSQTSLPQAYKTLMAQYNHMYAIGAKNRKRGFKPLSVRQVLKLNRRNNALAAKYPFTH